MPHFQNCVWLSYLQGHVWNKLKQFKSLYRLVKGKLQLAINLHWMYNDTGIVPVSNNIINFADELSQHTKSNEEEAQVNWCWHYKHGKSNFYSFYVPVVKVNSIYQNTVLLENKTILCYQKRLMLWDRDTTYSFSFNA